MSNGTGTHKHEQGKSQQGKLAASEPADDKNLVILKPWDTNLMIAGDRWARENRPQGKIVTSVRLAALQRDTVLQALLPEDPSDTSNKSTMRLGERVRCADHWSEGAELSAVNPTTLMKALALASRPMRPVYRKDSDGDTGYIRLDFL